MQNVCFVYKWQKALSTKYIYDKLGTFAKSLSVQRDVSSNEPPKVGLSPKTGEQNQVYCP